MEPNWTNGARAYAAAARLALCTLLALCTYSCAPSDGNVDGPATQTARAEEGLESAKRVPFWRTFAGRYQSFDRATHITLAADGKLRMLQGGVLQGGDYTCVGEALPLRCELYADFTHHVLVIQPEEGEATLDAAEVLRVYDWAGSFDAACEQSGGRKPARANLVNRCNCASSSKIFVPLLGGCMASNWRPF
jgi:hypothetical protein